MLKSKYNNPLEPFVFHGIKQGQSGDNHQYLLLIDEAGQTLIEQIASDSSTVLFCEMPNPETSQENLITEAINIFWNGDIGSYSYVYLFQLQ